LDFLIEFSFTAFLLETRLYPISVLHKRKTSSMIITTFLFLLLVSDGFCFFSILNKLAYPTNQTEASSFSGWLGNHRFLLFVHGKAPP